MQQKVSSVTVPTIAPTIAGSFVHKLIAKAETREANHLIHVLKRDGLIRRPRRARSKRRT